MRTESYSCDICNVAKQASNHWYIADITQVGISFHTWAWAEREDQLEGEEEIKGVRKLHLCGESCASKSLSEWFTAQQKRWEPLVVDKEAFLKL